MIRATLALALLVSGALRPAPVQAASNRFALLVANNHGGDELGTLRYAVRDAQRMAEVLSQFGGFSEQQIKLLENESSSEILAAFRESQRMLEPSRQRGENTLFLFYYSGHAKQGQLRPGESRLDMKLLKALLEDSRATVRVAIIDSCGAGAMTREKGGQVAPPFVIKVDDTLTSKGQVIIASSSSSEASQESDDIQGSFFTHYFSTGLRGAADVNKDGQVTLAEAYDYSYKRTVVATADTRSGTQHPTYEFDLRGAGDVVLAKFDQNSALLSFPEEISGQYYVVDESRQLIVAEIDKPAGQSRQLALKGGSYVIKKRLPQHLLMQRLQVEPQSSVMVNENSMEVVAFEDDYAKGSPVLIEEFEQGRIALSLSMAAGAQVVFDSPLSASDELFPWLGFVSIEARLNNLLRRNLLLSGDISFGTRQQKLSLKYNDYGDNLEYDLQYSQLQLGSSILYQWHLDPFSISVGPRLATLLITRSFGPEAPVKNQFFLTMSPGVVAVLGWSLSNWFHVEASTRAHYLLYTVDENKSFGYVEAMLSAWLDF